MDAANWIGWVSSGLLVVTLTQQVVKQWREKQSKGVSIWLFVGQLAASAGFLVYSWLVKNWVFIVTNGVLVVSAIAGSLITWHQKRHPCREPKPATAPKGYSLADSK